MNYTEIKNLALSYSDREDDDVIDRIDDFMRVVESRINSSTKVQKMAIRTSINTMADQEYYGLPSDFSGLRDIEIQNPDSTTSRQTLKYVSPEQMNNHAGSQSTEIFYTIIADQIQIFPAQDAQILEIVYYQQLPPLNSTNAENWVSVSFPDAYVFGLLVEVNAFVKDPEATMMWDARFKEALNVITSDDADTRWSGSALQIRTG